jgi:hypothetical protein
MLAGHLRSYLSLPHAVDFDLARAAVERPLAVMT